MSLDVSLHGAPSKSPGTGIFIRESGGTRELSRAEWDERFPDAEPVVVEPDDGEVFSLNITHNLGKMADKAGIYLHLWRPEEIGISKASDLIEPLAQGLERLKARPKYFSTYDAPNGWGNYDNLVSFVEEYLDACRENPDATIRVSR